MAGASMGTYNKLVYSTICGGWAGVCADPVVGYKSRCAAARLLQRVQVPDIGGSELLVPGAENPGDTRAGG